MDQRYKNLDIIISLLALLVLIYLVIAPNNDHSKPVVISSNICKEDSLRDVISNLQSQLEMEENGWDSKENRYEDILFEYEFGLDHLKNYHPKAYRDFHRIIGYKERYSHDLERENSKRLKTINKF